MDSSGNVFLFTQPRRHCPKILLAYYVFINILIFNVTKYKNIYVYKHQPTQDANVW